MNSELVSGAAGAISGCFFPFFALIAFTCVCSLIFPPNPPSTVNRSKKYSSKSTLNWLNKILTKLSPIITSPDCLKSGIENALRDLPKASSAIQRISLVNFNISPAAPVIDSAEICQYSDGEGVEFTLHYSPSLVVNTDLTIRIPVIGTSMSGGADLSVHKISGGVRCIIPPSKGEASIRLLSSTLIEVDAGARLGPFVSITSELLGPIWQQLIGWLHTYLLNLNIRVPIEEPLLNPSPKTQKEPGKQMISVSVRIDKSLMPYEL